MFFCCCIAEKQPEDQPTANNLKEELIHKQTKTSTEFAITKQEAQKGPPPVTQPLKQTNFMNPHLQKMRHIESCNTITVSLGSEQDLEIESVNPLRSLIKLPNGNEQSQKTKKQSQLWLQAGNKILYYVTQRQQQMVFVYKISKRKEEAHLINYILQPHRYSNKLRSKPIDLSLCLFISSQSQSTLRAAITNMITDHHVRPIFGVLKKQTELKIGKGYHETDYNHDIITIGNNCLRLDPFQRIIISLTSEKDFPSILNECQKITQQFQMQEMAKISFVFPSFLTLSEINTILSKLTRKFLISQKLQRAIKHLGYFIELFEDGNFQQVIIVSSNEIIYKEQQKSNKQFQLKLQLAIGLLMIEVEKDNVNIYEYIISNFLMDKTVSEYLKFIEFLHKQKKQFGGKLNQLSIFGLQQQQIIQKSQKIIQKLIGTSEKSITIKNRNKKKLGDFFRDYQATKTPVEQTQKKKEWDDDLRQHDIRATIMEKNHKVVQNSCNIFEVIDDSFVDRADLDILPNIVQMQFQEDE